MRQRKQNIIMICFLVGLHVALLISIFFLLINSNYEDRLYDTFVSKVVAHNMTQEQAVLSLLHATYRLLIPRFETWGDRANLGIRELFFTSADIQMLEGRWRCLSYTHVLARALQRIGIPVRIASMKKGDTWGSHIILEAKVNDRWLVLDTLYNLVFMRPDGKLANIQEVRQNWQYFKKQVPANYEDYNYEDIRYTNWDKIPIIMPFLKFILNIIMGPDNLKFFSIRTYFLNLYKSYAILLSMLYIFVLSFTIVYTISTIRIRNNKI